MDALKTQLMLKGIIQESDWDIIKEDISVDFITDNSFAILKDFEVLKDRIDMAQQVESLVEQGLYSKEWVRKNILGQTNDDIEQMDKQIADEKPDAPGDEEDDMFASTDNLEQDGELEADVSDDEATIEDEFVEEEFDLEDEFE